MSAENGHEVIDDVQELPGIDEKGSRNWLKLDNLDTTGKITRNVRIDV